MPNNLIIILVLFFGCQCKFNKLNLINYGNKTKPVIHIVSESDQEGVYIIKVNLQLDINVGINSSGKLYCTDEGIFIKLNEEKQFYKYFDFKKEIGEVYNVPVIYKNTNRVVDMIVDDIKLWNNKKVFKYRMKNSYSYYNEPLDIIFLVSKENGIIGAYFLGLFKNEVFMAGEQGNILVDVFDYTNLTRRTLK